MRWHLGSKQQIAWSFALVLLRMVVFGAVLYGVLRPLLGASDDRGSPQQIVQHGLLAVLAVVFVVVFLRRVARTSWRELGFEAKGLGRNIGLGFATFTAGLVIVGVRLWFADTSLSEAAATVMSYDFEERITAVLIGLHVVFGEEVIFRGYMQPGLAKRFGPAAGVALTALVFAAYHVQFSAPAFLGLTAWGLLWGAARQRSGSLVPSSVAHFLNWAVLGWL
ncbi:MAG: CPBP family intramembrane glutamic endopeptidase [Deltaproteobacteria bacterium]